MLNVKGAKTDMLKNQTKAFLQSLAKVLEIETEDLEVKVSAELEFYIVDTDGQKLKENLSDSSYLQNIVKLLQLEDKENLKFNSNKSIIENKNIRMESFEDEDGFNQFEVQFIPTNNPVELAENINDFKSTISKIVEQKYKIDFRAKPFIDEPTSSLHFHISVYYKGVNLFAKDNPTNSDEYYYLPLYWCIAGMLALTQKFIKYFAPTENCIERYCLPKRDAKYIHYPTRICWGFNNRTCAIRIPRKPSEDPLNCRIEHRISSSMADPYLALFAIFCGMQYGVAQELECPEPVYGRAYEDDEAGKLLIECF